MQLTVLPWPLGRRSQEFGYRVGAQAERYSGARVASSFLVKAHIVARLRALFRSVVGGYRLV